MFTSDVIKARNVHVECYKRDLSQISHGATFYTLNGKNVNVMLESHITHFSPVDLSIPIIWMRPFLVLGVPDGCLHWYCILHRNSYKETVLT